MIQSVSPLPPPVSRLQSESRWLLVLPPLIEFVLDIAMTLRGQPASYWSGQATSALEANPVGLYLLSWHPSAFILGAVAYAAMFSLAIVWLPEIVAFWISLGLLIAHASGTNSWLLYQHGSWGEGWHNSLAAVLAAVCYRTYFIRGRAKADSIEASPEKQPAMPAVATIAEEPDN